ncbi:YkuS family protein [Clostridium sp. MB40-C1]|uniref:YkuS family protein n=1 Tax=Clostridium sp. MB40-C1 TaxID=3070996 RepID=UPI0027E1238A|nr:YkuS family protein [Clostridium sp. MB40-C1]WMJ79147.1 YkuS family protein [Clostridium sp. MB40-C1]
MRKIAIEDSLTNVENYLKNAGYEVKKIDEKMKNNPACLNEYDAVVLNDLSRNMMGFENAITSIPTIDAVGMTPEQVKNVIESRTTK